MAAITSLSDAAQTEFIKLRHKYLNGSGELIQAGTKILQSGTFPDVLSTSVMGKGFLQEASLTGARELVLQSASEAAQFKVGDTLHCFTTAGAAEFTAVLVEGVKGQKVLVEATSGAASAGSICVKFADGQVGGQASGDSAGIAYVGAGDVAAFLQAIQDNITNVMYTGDIDIDATASADDGIYSVLQTSTDVPTTGGGLTPNAALLNGDLVTFKTSPAALVGCTARIIKHTTGTAVTITVGDIRDSNGTFLGNQFPVATSAAHSGGASASVSPDTDTQATLASGKADKYIRQLSGSTSYPTPELQGGVENSNDPGASNVLVTALFEMLQHFSPTGGEGAGDQELIPADLEEKLFGSMVKGSVSNLGTAQGKRVRLAAAAASGDSSLTVEKDNLVNDVPFPLSGSVRVFNNRGQGNTQGIDGAGVSANKTFTRTKRSDVLSLGSNIGITCKVGDIVELLPAHGMIKKPIASQISGEDMVTIMMAMRNCIKTIPTITVD